MFASTSLIAAILATSVLATPVKRDGNGSVNLVNNTPGDIPYALIAQQDPNPVSQGTLGSGQTVTFPMSPDMAGYVAKLAGPGGNPLGSGNILQLEYTYNSQNQNSVSYDWSIVDGPNPFTQYRRAITPAQPSDTCKEVACNAGQDDDTCEFVSPPDGPVVQCPVFDGVVLTATIG